MVYDVTNRESFDHLERWLYDARQLASENCVIMILANKTDVDRKANEDSLRITKGNRVVSTEEGFDFAKTHEVTFFEVSAMDDHNISDAMQILSSKIYEQHLIQKMKRSNSGSSARETPKGSVDPLYES